MDPDSAPEPLAATGERLIPELQHGELVHAEHLVRYRVAAQLANSRRVLDAACGTGYGTALLASAASEALGLDIDAATISYARSHHPQPTFVVGDVGDLPFEDGAFDLVVSFETIEHVRDPHAVLQELGRVLSEEGVLVISTPNKRKYLVENEFHEREFTHEEFVELVGTLFPKVELLLQQNWLASTVSSPEVATGAEAWVPNEMGFEQLIGLRPGEELYTLALCGRGQIPTVRPAVVAAGTDESHQLARRLVAAERSADEWHREFETAKDVAARWHDEYQTVIGVYDSIWWRMTAPLRWLADRIRRRDA